MKYGTIKLRDTWSYGDKAHQKNPILKVKVCSVRPVEKGQVFYKYGFKKVVFGKINGKGSQYAFPVGTGSVRFHEVRK